MNEIKLLCFDSKGYKYVGYCGDLERLLPLKSRRFLKVNGWLFQYVNGIHLKEKFAVFGLNGDIYLDFGSGPKNLSLGDLKIGEIRSTFCKRVIELEEKNGEKNKISILVSPLKYLFNDGMFPEDVEPITATLKRLSKSDERERLELSLSNGL